MSKYVIDSSTLTAIGDAVRGKDGSTDPILVSEIASRITNIPAGGDIEIALGKATTQWFYRENSLEEFWNLCPNGFDDVEMFLLFSSTSSSAAPMIVFPEVDKAYEITTSDGTTIYPIRAGVLNPASYGWENNYPYKASESKGYGFGINKENRTTQGLYTSNTGGAWSNIGLGGSSCYYCIIRSV